MRQTILIITASGREAMLTNCLNTIKTDYEVIVVCNGSNQITCPYPVIYRKGNQQELAGLEVIKEQHIDEGLIIHDTCEIKSSNLFKIVFEVYQGSSVAISNYPTMYGMFLGKYRYEVLKEMEIPKVTTKLEGIEQEMVFNQAYEAKETNNALLFLDFRDKPDLYAVYEEKWGRKNKVLENEYLKKYKGTWHREMAL